MCPINGAPCSYGKNSNLAYKEIFSLLMFQLIDAVAINYLIVKAVAINQLQLIFYQSIFYNLQHENLWAHKLHEAKRRVSVPRSAEKNLVTLDD